MTNKHTHTRTHTERVGRRRRCEMAPSCDVEHEFCGRGAARGRKSERASAGDGHTYLMLYSALGIAFCIFGGSCSHARPMAIWRTWRSWMCEPARDDAIPVSVSAAAAATTTTTRAPPQRNHAHVMPRPVRVCACLNLRGRSGGGGDATATATSTRTTTPFSCPFCFCLFRIFRGLVREQKKKMPPDRRSTIASRRRTPDVYRRGVSPCFRRPIPR